MKITWYPKNLLWALLLLAGFALALDMAIDFRRGAAVSLAALLVYACLDVLLTLNAALWWRRSSPR